MSETSSSSGDEGRRQKDAETVSAIADPTTVVSDSRAAIPPLVTVIVPCYNQQRYVAQTLDSVRLQTSSDWELVIVDDASTDDSSKRISEWLTEHRVPALFLSNTRNVGLIRGLARATREVRSAYVSLVAGDDRLMPRKLERQLSLLESEPEVGYVYSDALLIDTEGQRVDGTWIQRFNDDAPPLEGDLFVPLLRGKFKLPTMTMLMRTDLLAHYVFDPAFVQEDIAMSIYLASRSKGRFSSYRSAEYRLRPDGLRATLSPQVVARADLALARRWRTERRDGTRYANRRMAVAAYRLHAEGADDSIGVLFGVVRETRSALALAVTMLALLGVDLNAVVRLQHLFQRVTGRLR